jgi:endonuclease/exonuclease/phosphatase family metal-dependent hydrolase
MASCRRRHSSQGHHDTDLSTDHWKCDEDAHVMRCDDSSTSPSPPAGEAAAFPISASPSANGAVGFPSSGSRKAQGLWCEVDIPPPEWSLKTCPSSGSIGSTSVKVLTYNLYWWNLFDRHGGSDRSAGRLMKRTSSDIPYDFMAFQECEDVARVLGDAEMTEEFTPLNGNNAIAMAYRHSAWTLLSQNSEYVGEDSQQQYYGKRRLQWARFQNAEGKTVFFANHHGPLRVSQSGGCTGSATSLNIMRVIGQNAHAEDTVILVGDFNAQPHSSRIQELERRLAHVYSGRVMGGLDHVFSNCPVGAEGTNLGHGDGHHGSDHEALSVTFRI